MTKLILILAALFGLISTTGGALMIGYFLGSSMFVYASIGFLVMLTGVVVTLYALAFLNAHLLRNRR